MYVGRFMVASIDEKLTGVSELIRIEDYCNFDGTRSAINKISIEEIYVVLVRVAI